MNIEKLFNTMQKHTEKTNFPAVPSLFSRLRGILGRRCHPFLVIPFIILAASICYFNCGSRKALEILVYPPEYFISGTETDLRVIVLERETGLPAANAQVTVRLKKEKADQQEVLFKGKTGSYGSPRITFTVPAELEGNCELIAEAQSPLGSGNISIPIIVKKGFKILLTSDKSVYHPGQTIHMRGVVFENSKPASRQAVSIQVIEPSGYSVCNKTVNTCHYGIAEADFTLGNEIKTGDYTIRFFIGKDKKEKKVHVTDLSPPTFTAASHTEKTRNIPGQEIKNKKNVILRTDKSVYNTGETPDLTIQSTQQQGYVYIDILKENQIILTKESMLEAGKTDFKLPLTEKHTGTLTCIARIIPVPGQKSGGVPPVLLGQQKISVIPAEEEEIEITFQTSKKKYLPGEEAAIDILTRWKGRPCTAALGITIVDGSSGAAPPAAEDFLPPLVYRTKASHIPGSIRQNYSPRILYTNPRLMTNKDGQASFTVRLRDVESIPVSQWQVLALAHTLDGVIGSGTHYLPVNHGTFVDMALPPELTQNDEITIPVTIHNHQPSSQEVLLHLREDDWFELSGPAARKASVKAHEKKVEYFKIRVTGCGDHQVKLDTQVPGSGKDETLTRTVAVKPLGRLIQQAFNFILNGKGEIHKQLPIPGTAIKDSHNLLVRVYPGYFSQMVEGMESMLRMPHGCFEQTTSALYPDVMVLDYLKETGQSTPEIEEKAKGFISNGYQNLLRYETTPGGFSFYGGEPQKISTAFGLQLFSDMSNVYSIDKTLIPRMQKWLLSRMIDDHWEPDGHFGATSSARDNNFAATAYITSALLHSGLDKNNKGIKKAIAYLQKNHKSYTDNPNALSYCALSLIKAGKEAGGILQRLNKLARKDNYGMYWIPEPQVSGERILSTGATETTAIAALANLEANNRSIDISEILQYLLKGKNAYGIWGSTQATVLTLKVLKEVSLKALDDISGDVNIWMNNEHVNNIRFTGEDNKSTQEVDLKKDLERFMSVGNPSVLLKYDGNGDLFCQILLSYYVKWDEPSASKTRSPINLSLNYNTRRLKKGEVVTVDATASYKDKGVVRVAIIDIGIPPGFEVDPADFNLLRAKGVIERFEIEKGRIILYLNDLDQRGFRFGLKALSEGRVKMPVATIYDYYNPEMIHVAQPVEFTVMNR
jgi:5-hydroxyisourate hydrolase-like protein (transthyretin family)